MEELQLVWGWQPALYLFLGGMGAGAFIAAAVLLLVDGKNNRKVISISMWAATACLGIGLLLLLSELISPLRGLLLWQSFSNVTSWMTIGAWVVLVAAAVFFISAVLSLKKVQTWFVARSKSKASRIVTVCKGLALVGIILGVGVAIYTGMLLMWVPAVPLWGTFLLPALFTVSALDTGVALVEISTLSLKRRDSLANKGTLLLEKAVIILVVVEVIVLVSFMLLMLSGNPAGADGSLSYSATALASAQLLLTGELAVFFWVLFVACGLVIPLCAAIIGLANHKKTVKPVLAVGAVAALVGGCTLRFLILFAGAHADFVSDTISKLAL